MCEYIYIYIYSGVYIYIFSIRILFFFFFFFKPLSSLFSLVSYSSGEVVNVWGFYLCGPKLWHFINRCIP